MLRYCGIRVREMDRSRRFYTQGLDLTIGPTGRMAAGGVWQELIDPTSGAILELNFYPDNPPYREGDELDHLGFRVDRIDPLIERLLGLGGRLRIPPFREGGRRIAFLSDPDGIWIELVEGAPIDAPPTSQAVG
jgi:catechol 2,3-dioxygenase-like lactoylglutathione lyase family enzyme